MLFELDPERPVFPHPSLADEDGLLAVGGDLSAQRLLNAYSQGIFPWYSEETPILWYAPHERFVLYPQKIKISKSMQKAFARNDFAFTTNQLFEQVIYNCSSAYRKGQTGTWIVSDMIKAYIHMHQLGFAHSIEVWQNDTLVGGLYGILVGKVFCGESMFSKVPNASKAALIYLCQNYELALIDCQVHSRHLENMGAENMSQKDYLALLEQQDYKAHGLSELL
ncbi:leucyl/phenylalanyl-tRNA--protein transferase [Sphingobacterium sp. SGG-5]|uniref:leucyl/phenylalanyl-tRNA--protein transferase n=1 Tax=Sphingobacterium sp. SGG-5 TaxID=2710881 RepID=UPI0013EDB4FD|nr:leucyl/phenylalanyl-tRNA--protein transferase [Sphingobacterium sp. SGG-5]NGM60441.1 leucyl/phenylalanyl-tRNA--protein transferase [Sphingobacterium sp. SGG-5]